MITRIQALNCRCLRYIDQRLLPFHLLVGANATGKTTFLDLIALLHDVVSNGPTEALGERAADHRDLVFARAGCAFEVAVEARIPDDRRGLIAKPEMDTVRYEVALGSESDEGRFVILAEKLAIFQDQPGAEPAQRELFPSEPVAPESVLSPKSVPGTKTILSKAPAGNDNFQPETAKEKGKRWVYSFKLGSTKSTLGNLPDDEEKFPVATWFRDLLSLGVQRFVLNSALMRKASPPTRTRGFLTDGSNLPWVVETLKTESPDRFRSWVRHLQTALKDLEDVRTVEMPDTKYRHLVLKYRGGIEIPSWVASDGTLRLMALTLPAYVTDFAGIYLIEEPENGIHPKAVETAYQSLSSVYDAQILLATHSPVLLSLVDADEAGQVLCFAKNPDGSTDIVSGDRHPKLREWRGDPNLSLLFAGGVLG